MAETAAHLVDSVLPHVPVRQWVLSLPFRIRYLLGYNPVLCRDVRRIFVRTVLSWMRRHARRFGLEDGRSGAVCFLQRFDSSLRLNVHLHLLVLDGIYICPQPRPLSQQPVFHETPPPEDEDIARLVAKLRDRIVRHLQRQGHLPDGEEASGEGSQEDSLFATLQAAAVQGRCALGPKAGSWTQRLDRDPCAVPVFETGRRCAALDGFSLHADVRVGSCARTRLEQLCRYVARPPIATERLSLTADGSVIYRLKRRFKDGSTAVVFEPLAFLERLAALVPRPRFHLVTYHGVLAPAASLRDRIVPEAAPRKATACPASTPTSKPDPQSGCENHRSPQNKRTTRYSWAELMRRVFEFDVLVCHWCGGARRVLTFLTDPIVIHRILSHLGLPTDPPPIAPARSPPDKALLFDSI